MGHAGMDGMERHAWEGFMEMASQGTSDVPLDIILVDLGGGNLAQQKGKLLILQVITDLQTIKARFPEVHIIW